MMLMVIQVFYISVIKDTHQGNIFTESKESFNIGNSMEIPANSRNLFFYFIAASGFN